MKNESSSGGGIGFAGLLTILFITLKLCHVINWSWWWVLSPIWIPASMIVFVLIFAVFGYWFTRPKTPEEKVSAAFINAAKALRDRR